MGHMRFDDRFLDHPKFVRLEQRAPSRGLHLFMGLVSYSKLHLTDGRVPRDMIGKVNGPHARWRAQALEALIEVRLVDVDGDDLVVHDFLDWQPSREKILGRGRGKSEPLTRGRSRGDAQVIEGRHEGDAQVIDDRQHIKRDDPADLNAPRLVRARADSYSYSDTNSEDPPYPQTPDPDAAGAVAQTASTGSAKPGKRSKTPRARTQCPLDFEPDDTTTAKATSLGFGLRLEREVREGFVDWWRGKGLLQADWQATYRNWLRKEAKTRGIRPPRAETPEQLAWLERKRAAESPVKAVPPPRGFNSKVASLFG